MEDFFKQFRVNLERRRYPAFEEKDWQDMEKRLEQQRGKHPAFQVWGWLVWPFLFLSLCVNALYFIGLKRGDLKTAFPEIRKDTVFLIQTIVKTDTVYQIRVVREKIPESRRLPLWGRSLAATDLHALSETYPQAEPMKTTNKKESHPSQVLSALSELPLPRPQLSTLHPPPSTSFLSQIAFEPVVHKQRKNLPYYWYAMRPKGFRLGIAGGWAYPFDQGLQQRGGYMASLEANVEFSPQLRLWAGAAYFNTHFTTDRIDAAIGIPDIAPPSPGFTFVEAEALQPSLEYAAGMQYFFRASKRFKPFLGLGYSAVSLRPYEVIYEFENQPLGVEWSFEKTVNRNEFSADMLLLQTGFEYEIFKKWHWQLRTTYRTDLKKSGIQTSDQLRVQTGWMRRF